MNKKLEDMEDDDKVIVASIIYVKNGKQHAYVCGSTAVNQEDYDYIAKIGGEIEDYPFICIPTCFFDDLDNIDERKWKKVLSNAVLEAWQNYDEEDEYIEVNVGKWQPSND